MPVIVIGADTVLGEAVVAALQSRRGELRAFVSDVATGQRLRSAEVKVAVGDVSDGSHMGGAALGCFGAVIVPEAALDDRERSFAEPGDATIETWRQALVEAEVHRVIWLEDARLPDGVSRFEGAVPEVASVATDGDPTEVGREVARIDDLATLDGA